MQALEPVPAARPKRRPLLALQSDERLAELVQAGNELAFEALVLRHRPQLLRYSARIVSGDRAEDVVQHTFIRAYEVLTDGAGIAQPRPWLFRVAHNAALDALRDRSLQHVELDESLNGVERPDQAFERGQSIRDLTQAVQGLPARQRDAIVLRELEGRSYEEIARQLDVSGGAVRQLLARARATVRSACTALTPYALLARVPLGASDPITARVVEVAGGAGVPVVVAHVCAAAIVTCAPGGGALDGLRPERDAGRANTAQAAPERVLPLAATPLLAASVPAAVAPSAGVEVPDELSSPSVFPPPAEPSEETVPVGLPVESPEVDEPPAIDAPVTPPLPPPPTGYATPGHTPDPLACLGRRRVRAASCQVVLEDPPPVEEEPPPPPKEELAPAQPPADPPASEPEPEPSEPPPDETPASEPPAEQSPPPSAGEPADSEPAAGDGSAP